MTLLPPQSSATFRIQEQNHRRLKAAKESARPCGLSAFLTWFPSSPPRPPPRADKWKETHDLIETNQRTSCHTLKRSATSLSRRPLDSLSVAVRMPPVLLFLYLGQRNVSRARLSTSFFHIQEPWPDPNLPSKRDKKAISVFYYPPARLLVLTCDQQ